LFESIKVESASWLELKQAMVGEIMVKAKA
jgi:hypothetical protein